MYQALPEALCLPAGRSGNVAGGKYGVVLALSVALKLVCILEGCRGRVCSPAFPRRETCSCLQPFPWPFLQAHLRLLPHTALHSHSQLSQVGSALWLLLSAPAFCEALMVHSPMPSGFCGSNWLHMLYSTMRLDPDRSC